MCMVDVAAVAVGKAAVDIECERQTFSYSRSVGSSYTGRGVDSSTVITCYNYNGGRHVNR